MDDIRAVMDAAGSKRAALFGVSDGGCLCIAFAVAHPERAASLVTYGSFARRLRSADYPWGWSAEHLKEVLHDMDRGWATGAWWSAANPSVADDEGYQAWWARYLWAAASPAMGGRGALRLNAELDIRHLLWPLTQVSGSFAGPLAWSSYVTMTAIPTSSMSNSTQTSS
jgi:pimeloyl-ACP methyl ester carboxylesterase